MTAPDEATVWVGRFAVPTSHPCLPGHFPRRAVVPGVVLLETALAAIVRHHSATRVVELDAVRFITPVLPDQEVEVGFVPAGPGLVSFACSVAGRVVARGRARLAS